MRLFVAIFPPPEVQKALAESRDTLRVEGAARWTRPENIHLTLKFLGEVPDERSEGFPRALKEISGRHGPFELLPSGFGGFPSKRKARVVWAGMTGQLERLRALAEDVEATFATLGFEREKRGFSPHLTVGRAKNKPVTLGTEQEVEAPGFGVEEIRLVKSETRREGAVYTPLEAFRLSLRKEAGG